MIGFAKICITPYIKTEDFEALLSPDYNDCYFSNCSCGTTHVVPIRIPIYSEILPLCTQLWRICFFITCNNVTFIELIPYVVASRITCILMNESYKSETSHLTSEVIPTRFLFCRTNTEMFLKLNNRNHTDLRPTLFSPGRSELVLIFYIYHLTTVT